MARTPILTGPALVLVAALASAACSHKPPPPPPAPLRQPGGVADIVGIWHTIHRHTLQLREKRTYILVTGTTPPLAGTYQLRGDQLEFTDRHCGGTPGTYTVRVAFQERLELQPVSDACADRRIHLTLDPWVYANP